MIAEITVDKTDSDIVEAFRCGNKALMQHFYKSHFGSILHMVTTNGGDEADAKDVYQEAVIIIYEKISSSSLVLNCRLKTYLYSICRNLWLKQLHARGKFTARIEDIEGHVAIEYEGVGEKERDANFNHMKMAMSQIGEPCHTLLNDFYIHKLSMTTIAEKFGYTNADNAKNQRYKCMNRLKKIFFDLKR